MRDRGGARRHPCAAIDVTMTLPTTVRFRLRRWLFWRYDEFTDRLCEKDWAPDWMFGLPQRIFCAVLRQHQPIDDQCGLPDHDFCAWCHTPMPGKAPR